MNAQGTVLREVFQDASANRQRPHIALALALLRLAQIVRTSSAPGASFIATPLAALYRIYSLFGLGIDIPVSTSVGKSIQIHHGMALVVHASARIGDNVILRHSTTIGARNSDKAPIISSGCDIGAHVLILGDVTLGANCVVGAASLVLNDFEPESVLAGNPARRLR